MSASKNHDQDSATRERPFDPLRDLFVAQSSRPSEVREINLRALTPFQRALLVIDGTLTKFIEAYTLEPVEVLHQGQEIRVLEEDHEWLEVPAGTELVARQVILRGKYSHSFHAYATSLIVPARLGQTVQEAVDSGSEGLGRILLANEMETRREVLWYGMESTDELPPALRRLVEGELISRTYRIFAHQTPILLINEKFPSGESSQPSHY